MINDINFHNNFYFAVELQLLGIRARTRLNFIRILGPPPSTAQWSHSYSEKRVSGKPFRCDFSDEERLF